MLDKFNFRVIPAQIFLFVFWLKNGVIDKFFGILNGVMSPDKAYPGDTWSGWESYIVGTWDKSEVAHALLSPTFDIAFPVLILLQMLPVAFAVKSIISREFFVDSDLTWIKRAATASLFVTSGMLFTQTLAGASDGQYLWQLLGFGMILQMYLKQESK